MVKNNNSLLKNTIALYIRMVFSVCINLYVSRIALKALGVDDFGVYNVVGGIIVLLGFINSSMGIATSRFLTLAIGKKDEAELQRVYNAAFVLHLCIAFIVFILAETIGLWIVNGYLNLETDRIMAANFLFQFSVAAAIMSFVQVPFLAMIMSDERMSVYARIDITNNLLKLAAAIAIGFVVFDRLIVYGLLLFIASIAVFLMYWGYCKRHYGKYKLKITWDWLTIKPMLYFSGWDLLGCGGFALQSQGRQIFINKFFTLALNAANGIALTVGSALSVFTNNIVLAFRPRILKNYSVFDYQNMSYMTENAMIIVLLLMSVIFVPLFIEMDFILGIWLVDVPEMTTALCRMTLMVAYLEVINTVVKIGIHASGRMKWFTIFSFSVNCIMLALTFLFFTLGSGVLSAYYIAFALTAVDVIYNYILLHRYVPNINLSRLVVKNILGIVICMVGFTLCNYLDMMLHINPWLKLLTIAISNGVLVLLTASIIYRKQIAVYLEKNKTRVSK